MMGQPNRRDVVVGLAAHAAGLGVQSLRHTLKQRNELPTSFYSTALFLHLTGNGKLTRAFLPGATVAASELVESHSKQEHNSARRILIKRRHVHEAHAIVQATHQ
jgi:hypothetical protein